MSAFPFSRDQEGAVEHRQSTYWDLRFQEAGLWRVHFKGKKESWFDEPGTFEALSICSSHPLLADYQDPWDCVYLSGPIICSIDLVERLKAAVVEETDGWRSANRYLNDCVDLYDLMEGGYGMLFRAPRRIGRRLARVLFEADARFTNLPYGAKSEDSLALILGRSYVVASGFQYESLSGAF